MNNKDLKFKDRGRRKNICELYHEYKIKWKNQYRVLPQIDNPLDNYLRQVNPYYYSTRNVEIKYKR